MGESFGYGVGSSDGIYIWDDMTRDELGGGEILTQWGKGEVVTDEVMMISTYLLSHHSKVKYMVNTRLVYRENISADYLLSFPSFSFPYIRERGA